MGLGVGSLSRVGFERVVVSLWTPSVPPPRQPSAFTAWCRDHQIRLIDTGYRAAMEDMACNVLALGQDRVISPRHSSATNAALRAEGLTVLDPELRLFAHGGGSAHCMSMALARDPD